MTKRDFITVEDWTAEEVDGLLALAARVKRGEVLGGLERKVLAMVFMDPSLRTRTSFETAMFLHGGHAVVLEPGKSSWSLETEPGAVMDGTTVEHIKDAARVLGRYADAVGIRSFPRGIDWPSVREDRIVRDFARYCEKPVINMESVRRHPCQQLADAMTLRERLGDPTGKRFVLMWGWHPKALPTAVPASAALAAAHLGMEIVIARPDGYELDPEDTALVRRIAQARGGEFVHIMNDPDEAVVGRRRGLCEVLGGAQVFRPAGGGGQLPRRAPRLATHRAAAQVHAGRSGDGDALSPGPPQCGDRRCSARWRVLCRGG